MATFTWTATGSGTTAWETAADWVDSTGSIHPTLASFTASPGNDYVISSSNLFTINNIGAGGTNAPDIANSITLSNASISQAKLVFAAGGALDVTTMLKLNGLMNMGTVGPVENSVLSMGGTAGGGTIDFGANGLLEGAVGDKIVDIGTSPTEIMGSGTIQAQGGLFTIGPSVDIASGTLAQDMKFQINSEATLLFSDVVGGGTVVFGAPPVQFSPSGELEVARLSTFNAAVKGLFVGGTVNVASSFIDFQDAGTAATATLTGITAAGATLTVNTGSISQVIPIKGNYSTLNANVNYLSDGVGGIDVFLTDLPCYAAGTAILTPDGEVAVETIQAGDAVMTSEAGRLVPRTVKWTGFREIDLTRHARPAAAAPIRFRQGALGDGLPARDLLLSPDHCLFIDGGLIPARLLVNGMTVVRDLDPRTICYHHIELERHGVLIAEGVAAESYLDTGNRAYFSHAGMAAMLHPEFEINANLRCWDTDACAPLMVRPEMVRPVWQRLAVRAKALGYAEPVLATTSDPDLRLEVDGKTVRPLLVHGRMGDRMVSFMVPEGAASVRLVSRSAQPAERQPWVDDPRLLGVAVRSMALRDRTGETVLGADHPALTDGWHAAEHAADGAPWRWTGGDAVLPIISDGPCLLEITLSAAATYLDDFLAA